MNTKKKSSNKSLVNKNVKVLDVVDSSKSKVKLVSKRSVVIVKSSKTERLSVIKGGKVKTSTATEARGSLRNAINAKNTLNINKAEIVTKNIVIESEIFVSGDKIVYPGHGVGEIENVNKTEIGGQVHQFYSIKIIESGMKVMVPVSQAGAVGLRRIVDKKSVDKVYQILKDRNFKIDTQTWNRRYREYSQKIKTGSVFEIAMVLRDLAVLGNDKDLSFGEKKMKDMAEGLLVSELSIAKSRPIDKIQSELREIFN